MPVSNSSANLSSALDNQSKELLLAGIAQHRAGALENAEARYLEVLNLHPHNPFALNAMGALAFDRGQTTQALNYYNQAAKADPSLVLSYQNMAKLFLSIAQYDKAEICYRQALKIDPNNYDIARLLAKTLARQDKCSEADTMLDAIAAKRSESLPMRLERLHTVPHIWPNIQAIANWRSQCMATLDTLPILDIAQHLDELYYCNAGIDSRILCHGLDNLVFRTRYAKQFTCSLPVEFRSNDGEKKRIGIHVSMNHENVCLKILSGMLERWEYEDIQLFVICQLSGREKFRKVIRNPRIGYIVVPEDLRDTVKTVRDAALDMVYYWEIGSNSANYILPMIRLAPVQCTSWGSVETTGLPQIDWFASSVPQEGDNPQRYYSENLYMLEHIPAFLRKPPQSLYTTFSRSDFGMTDHMHAYVLPHHLWKLHPDVDAAVAQVLARDSHAHMFFVEGVVRALTARYRERLLTRIDSTHADRIHFIPYQDYPGYLSLLASADVVLDTLHYSGGQTSMEAFGAGTPVVTLPGTHMRGRSTHACYRVMGLETAGAVANDISDYVEKALAIGTEKQIRQTLKERILSQNSILYENMAMIDDHASFFRYIINAYRSF